MHENIQNAFKYFGMQHAHSWSTNSCIQALSYISRYSIHLPTERAGYSAAPALKRGSSAFSNGAKFSWIRHIFFKELVNVTHSVPAELHFQFNLNGTKISTTNIRKFSRNWILSGNLLQRLNVHKTFILITAVIIAIADFWR